MLFCDSRRQCFAWLVNLTAVAVYSTFPNLWCSTVDSIQLHVACCTAVSCRWRYITDFSLFQLLPWSCPNYLPAIIYTICVLLGGCCVVLATFTEHCATSFRDMMRYINLYWIIVCLRNPYIYITILFPVDINHVKYYIDIVDINTNYVFLSEHSNWTTDSTCWRESVHMSHV